jgi:hypothetical protein
MRDNFHQSNQYRAEENAASKTDSIAIKTNRDRNVVAFDFQASAAQMQIGISMTQTAVKTINLEWAICLASNCAN